MLKLAVTVVDDPAEIVFDPAVNEPPILAEAGRDKGRVNPTVRSAARSEYRRRRGMARRLTHAAVPHGCFRGKP
jgi:hypothetical protein